MPIPLDYAYSVGPTIFLMTINLDNLVTSNVTSFTDPDGADVVTLNFQDFYQSINFMYTTALRSRMSAYQVYDQSLTHFGYLPAHDRCEIEIASYMQSALTTCGKLSLPNFRTQFAATRNASSELVYTVDILGRPLTEWNSLIHVSFPP